MTKAMRRTGLFWWIAVLFSGIAVAQSDANLDRVLNEMDTASKNFRSAQANFEWDQYTKVVDETDKQTGKVYYRRQGQEVQMAADIEQANGHPEPRNVLYADGKVQMYQPKIDQVTDYNTSKNKAEVESFLVLGFGGSGHDMLNSFDVKYLGTEKLGDIQTEKLDLSPKNPKLRNLFPHIVLWIDPQRGISVQQQLFQPSGDYRLAKYSDIQVNQKLPDSAFKLKTTSKTQVLTQG